MPDGRQIAVALTLIIGIALVAFGATWKLWHRPQMLWSKEQAAEYNDAWRALKVAATSGLRRADPTTDPKLAAAQARYDSIKAELDRAIAYNDYTGTLMAAVGAVVTAIGGWLLWSRSQSASSANSA
jgi:hypothetical protein